MERVATPGIYHAWALERRLRYVTTCPHIRRPQDHSHVVGRVTVKGSPFSQTREAIVPDSRAAGSSSSTEPNGEREKEWGLRGDIETGTKLNKVV